MGDPMQLAQELWDLAQSDASVAAILKKERKDLLLAITKGENTGDIVNASKNGSSYTARPGYTIGIRLAALSAAIRGLDEGIRPNRNQRVKFL